MVPPLGFKIAFFSNISSKISENIFIPPRNTRIARDLFNRKKDTTLIQTLSVTVHSLKHMKQNNEKHVLIDVREPAEFDFCQIKDSINIPMQLIPVSLKDIPRDIPLIIMCHSGVRSSNVAGYLKENGFDPVYNLTGGIDAWALEIDSTVPRY